MDKVGQQLAAEEVAAAALILNSLIPRERCRQLNHLHVLQGMAPRLRPRPSGETPLLQTVFMRTAESFPPPQLVAVEGPALQILPERLFLFILLRRLLMAERAEAAVTVLHWEAAAVALLAVRMATVLMAEGLLAARHPVVEAAAERVALIQVQGWRDQLLPVEMAGGMGHKGLMVQVPPAASTRMPILAQMEAAEAVVAVIARAVLQPIVMGLPVALLAMFILVASIQTGLKHQTARKLVSAAAVAAQVARLVPATNHGQLVQTARIMVVVLAAAEVLLICIVTVVGVALAASL